LRQTVQTKNLQNVLDEELERLKRLLRMGYELKVVWLPNNNSNLSGEVKGETIYVYEEELEKALETLKHEFLDYSISQVIEPYRQLTNKLIMLINEEAYKRKEMLVENLRRLI
jgi:thermostable 8-oxoguanine DNA glycosylase